MMLIQSGSVSADRLGPRHRLEPAAARRRLDPLQRHRAPPSLARGARRRHRCSPPSLISPSLVAWMSPTIVGLILAIPLSWASGQLWLGLGMRRIGLLRTPEETTPPPIVERANALAAELARVGHDHEDALLAIHADPALRAVHEAFLPEKPRHRRGDVDVDARGRRRQAQRRRDDRRRRAPGSSRANALAVLADRALIAMLARLPSAADAPKRPVDTSGAIAVGLRPPGWPDAPRGSTFAQSDIRRRLARRFQADRPCYSLRNREFGNRLAQLLSDRPSQLALSLTWRVCSCGW